MAKERSTPRYIKIAQDVCGKILTGEYPEGTLLKGRSVLGASYGVSPETVRKALNILEKEKVVSSKRGVGVFVDSVLHAQEFANKWKAETQIKDKYATLEKLPSPIRRRKPSSSRRSRSRRTPGSTARPSAMSTSGTIRKPPS